MTRRTALTRLSVSGVAAALGAVGQRADAGGQGGDVIERFVVGPFQLAEWFRPDAAKGLLEEYAVANVPDIKDFNTALNASPLFLICSRDVTNPKTPLFPEKNHDPLLAIAGTPIWSWTEKDASFTIRVKKMDVACDTIRNGESPPWQRVIASVALQFIGENVLIRSSCTYNVVEEIAFEVSGKLLSCKRP